MDAVIALLGSGTPWDQAERFGKNYIALNKNVGGKDADKPPTFEKDRLRVVMDGWTGSVLNMAGVPSWVFLQKHDVSLFEWASNIKADLGRRMMGYAKLQSVMTNGGMIFIGSWHKGRLHVPCFAVVRDEGVFMFQWNGKEHVYVSADEWKRLGEIAPF